MTDVAKRALSFILAQWEYGFREAAHVLAFPREQGFSVGHDRHEGDIFARALIADALQCANQVLNGALDRQIEREIAYLLSARRGEGVGGWSYFPTLVELPPDADDLAQILLLLLQDGQKQRAAALCLPAIQTLLRYGTHPDGGIETWIVPSPPRSDEQRLQAQWVELAWGKGADAEVMANLLHALALYDSRSFAQTIAAGANYIASRQEPDGSWRSSWYHGPFYGTFVCMRLLAGIAPQHPAVERAFAFLISSQRNDGGWAMNGSQSDVLSTALAILALAASRRQTEERVANSASQALEQLFLATADAPPFIRMDLGRAGGVVRAQLTYASKTVTAAFALKAALSSLFR